MVVSDKAVVCKSLEYYEKFYFLSSEESVAHASKRHTTSRLVVNSDLASHQFISWKVTWSKYLDLEVSVCTPSTLPPTLDLDLWGEICQDLSSLCPKPLEDTSSTDRILQNELNTPKIGKTFFNVLMNASVEVLLLTS